MQFKHSKARNPGDSTKTAMEKTTVNLFVIPLNSLLQDLQQRLTAKGIAAKVYESNIVLQDHTNVPQVILVNYYNASLFEFELFLCRIVSQH